MPATAVCDRATRTYRLQERMLRQREGYQDSACQWRRVCCRQELRLIKHGPKIQVGHVKEPAVDVVLEILESALHLELSQFRKMPLQAKRILISIVCNGVKRIGGLTCLIRVTACGEPVSRQ